MRLGVVIVQTRPWRQLAGDFRLMEEIGYDAAYVYDHLTHPTAAGGWLADGFATLAAAASVTDRIELGPLVASAMLHSPVSLARRAATVQDVSGGRLILGVGAGSPREPLADTGTPVTTREMSERFADLVTGLDAVWGGATAWQGSGRSFEGLQTRPLPAGAARPFLLLAAHGPRALALTARYADGWNTYGGWEASRLDPAAYWALVREQCERLGDACERAGRDPGTLRRSLLLGFGTVRPTSSVAAYQDAIGRAGELGFDELVVYGPFALPAADTASDLEVHAEVLAGR
ncbi:LLM class flavin-dependent oxidoreductase [Nocardioides sp. BP30]|uniref:LLM class flavin-dependent oxidoreductase n=1 Tax=Nocardioides sp. BP30 TaxID=3036374 RepID=UPI002468EE89|nr:LLM class flavin-dependent oxidoreductase [Nocardioides sp. BP30]WGL54158.1 LLM class flavin-dependent oxidoreductase [Nocardioides sp. BP30]